MKIKFEWPLVWKKNAETELQKERRRLMDTAEREMNKLVSEWRKKWEPLLREAIALRAQYQLDLGTFALTVMVDRNLMEMAAMHNDDKVWEYVTEQLSWEIRRQISTLNFSGLGKLAAENERRYPSVWDGPGLPDAVVAQRPRRR